jgi:probable rRNA maturation factor
MDFPVFPDFPSEETPTDPIVFQWEDVLFDLPEVEAVQAWLQIAAEGEGKEIQEVTYIFCSDEYLLGVNLEYLQHDYYTDVITFPYSEDRVHGDIYISSERVADNARTHKVTFQHELSRVMVHGLLHLAGYTDKTAKQRAKMTEREDYWLRNLLGK